MNKHTIGGTVTVKNAIKWDYCLKQCIESLLPICDDINVVWSPGEDATFDMVRHLQSVHGEKIRLMQYDYPVTTGNVDTILDKMNWGRERLHTDYHLHLEADEVLGAESYEYILKAAEGEGVVLAMHRINFWIDSTQVLAPGFILSPSVIRFAPTVYWLGGDAPHPKATQTEPVANWNAMLFCKIYHYGFLREEEGYLGKYKDLMRLINCSERADPDTLAKIENTVGKNWMKQFNLPTIPFTGKHPDSMIQWLKDRNRIP